MGKKLLFSSFDFFFIMHDGLARVVLAVLVLGSLEHDTKFIHKLFKVIGLATHISVQLLELFLPKLMHCFQQIIRIHDRLECHGIIFGLKCRMQGPILKELILRQTIAVQGDQRLPNQVAH